MAGAHLSARDRSLERCFVHRTRHASLDALRGSGTRSVNKLMRMFTAQILGVDFDEFQINRACYEKQVDLSLGGGNKIETTYADGR